VGLCAQTADDAPGAVRLDNFEVRQPAVAAGHSGIQALRGDEKAPDGGLSQLEIPQGNEGNEPDIRPERGITSQSWLGQETGQSGGSLGQPVAGN